MAVAVAVGFVVLPVVITPAQAQERIRCNFNVACQAKRDGVSMDVARERNKADLSCMRKAGFSRAQWMAYKVGDAKAAIYRACIASFR